MVCSGQPAQHDADHGEAEEGGDGSGVAFEVAGQTAVAADPGKGALDDPALGQDNKTMSVAALDDLQSPRAGAGDKLGGLWSLVAGVGEDAFDEREGSPRHAQNLARAVAILHIGRVDDHAQQEAQRIDQDVALAAGDLLARIKALRIERAAPF
jgi:hypothetical protein